MNLDDLYTVDDHDNGAEMQVENQVGKKVDMYLTVVGIDSKKWQNLKSKAKRVISDDTTVEEAAKILSDAIIGWRNVEHKGKELKFTRENAERLLVNAPYVIGQVIRFIINRENFMKG